MAEIIPFPGLAEREQKMLSSDELSSMSTGTLLARVNEVLFNPGNYSFEDWKSQIEAFLGLQSREIENQLFHSGVSLFSHPEMTPEFSKELLLYMARSPDDQIRKRLLKNLSQFEVNLPAEIISEVKEALSGPHDPQVTAVQTEVHDEVIETILDESGVQMAA